ncbi:MAG: ribosome biogenesis GTP-binding protein YihA/YsxC [Chitinophagales bacterium]|nr:ribosome biogenesis GTP-binding protein YihA/YsxC [Chitinophagales bacterium]
MLIESAEFTGSFTSIDACPKSPLPQFAFAGRSNVGKSSLINMLCGRKSLAKVSVTPGKTQTLNFYLINRKWFLVDLPGYGYARSSKEKRAFWMKMIEKYLLESTHLATVFLLIDSRITAQQNDLNFIEWMGVNEIPFCIVFTKADHPSSPAIQSNIMNFKNTLLKTWEYLPQIFISSSEKGIGRTDILKYIEQTLQELRQTK